MMILIAAAAENNALGKDNQLLWHLPNDFKRFKQITTGHYIVLGRKTFESFPKPLPNRTHVIITRQKNYQAEGCIIVNSVADALKIIPKGETTFIIGGAEIYNQTIDFADKIELTRVHTSLDADAYFPKIDPAKWHLSAADYNTKDEKHAFDFTFQTFTRK
jgi:dihydrofolate reductase